MPTEPKGFVVMCQLAPQARDLYAVSVRRLALLHSGFLQTGPRGPAPPESSQDESGHTVG